MKAVERWTALGLCMALAAGSASVAKPAPKAKAAPPPATAPATTPATPAPAKPKSLADAVAGLQKLDGLLPVYVDKAGGRVLLALPAPDTEGLSGRFLYQTYLRSSLGSTPVGLDRSQPGDTQVVVFRRAGKKVVAEFENYGFRAEHGSADEKEAVRQSFAASIVWQGEITAESPDGRLLVDVSGFLTRDALNISQSMKRAQAGGFKPDKDLSYVETGQTLAFPDNLEFEATQTFTSDDAGSEVRGIVPDARSMTLVVHHSLIKLPDPGYTPRLYDPRVGTFTQVVADYSAPLGDPLVYRLANRFRLEKVDPTAAKSRVKKPIVFYIDRAAPEPVRSALREGAQWWNQAFEAAGFIDAFKVEILPDGVNPLDARYNVINWVHRQTRGWSYGQGIIDPRTGEIVKGSVLLGSQRIRQDKMIFEGLEGADKTGKGGPNDPIVVSLARLRQLAVHENGHAIGLAHNMGASTYGDRASVMDYPAPRVKITADGQFDFSDAYAVGVGEWDRFAVTWLYSQTPPGQNERARLNALVADAQAHGIRFVADEDSRPVSSGHPLGALWDDGTDSIAELDHILKVRRIALDRFGQNNLPDGSAMADLKRVIVPIYLYHRYQVDAAVKHVGGVDFGYGVKGDGHEAAIPDAPDVQRRALAALMRTVDPAELDLPDPLVALLSAAQSGDNDKQWSSELFDSGEGPVFDLGTAAETAADITFSDLLAAQRLNRVADLSSRDPGQLGVAEVLDTVIGKVFTPAAGESPRRAELRRRLQTRLVYDLASSLDDKSLSSTVAAQIRQALVNLGHRLQGAKGAGADAAQAHYLADLLLEKNEDRLRSLAAANAKHPVTTPPGMPIGEDCWFCEGLQR